MGWIKLSTLPEGEVRIEQYNKSRVYWKIEDGCVLHQRRKLRRADAETFEVRSDEYRFLGRDARAIYHAWSEVTQADRDTFEVLGDNYFCDSSQGFFEFETSLRPLKGGDAGDFANLGGGYAKDAAYGYYSGKPLRSCSCPMSLRSVTDDPVYAIDDQSVYFDGRALKSVDSSSWTLLTAPGFSRDRSRVFYGASALPRVDLETWRHLTEGYSRDDARIYHWHYSLKAVDLGSWEPVDHHYSKDADRVFYFGKEVESADAGSFSVTDEGTAHDRFGKIEYGRRIPPN